MRGQNYFKVIQGLVSKDLVSLPFYGGIKFDPYQRV